MQPALLATNLVTFLSRTPDFLAKVRMHASRVNRRSEWNGYKPANDKDAKKRVMGIFEN